MGQRASGAHRGGPRGERSEEREVGDSGESFIELKSV